MAKKNCSRYQWPKKAVNKKEPKKEPKNQKKLAK
jgi:hypothetical protein